MAAKSNSRKALGKGLGALIKDADKSNEIVGSIQEIVIENIKANPYQPRTEFDEENLIELAQSIKELGVIQPITVIKDDKEEGKYILISGERRFRASKMAGLKTIPAYIKPQADDKEMLEMALVENIQREDLDAISVAIGYKRLLDEYEMTQDDLGKRIGKNRSTITNYLRLLKLPAEIQLSVKQKQLSMGHARALLALENAETQLKIFARIMEEGLSVREVEKIVKDIDKDKKGKTSSGKQNKEKEILFAELQSQMANYFNVPVKISQNKKGKGKIEIAFKNEEELVRIISIFDKLKGQNN